MTPIAIILFMTGVICCSSAAHVSISLPVWRGAARPFVRPDTSNGREHRTLSWRDPRSLVPAVSWLVVAVYGLVLASVEIVVGR